IEGIEPSPVAVRFRNAAGEKVLYNGVPRIGGRLRKVGNPLVRDTDRLRSITARPFKVTLPAASWFLPSAFYEQGVTDRFYDSHEELLEDTLAIQRELIAEAIGAGARYVQLDFPNYVQLVDAGAREYAIVRQGIDPEEFLDKALDLDRREIEQAARHADVGQLAISPQCGFASVSDGNELSADDQWRKLEVVARTADEVWGPAG